MPQKAFTFRIEASTRAALENLSRILHKPMNKLINEAVRAYVVRRGRQAERDLEASLASLRDYRRGDPDFEQAIAAFAEAEAAVEDPIEGGPATDGGPVRAKIRRLLHG